MKTLLLHFTKPIYTIVGIMFLVLLTACSATDDVSVLAVQQTQTETVVPEKSQTTALEPPSFDDYEGYINYISDIPSFEPYYKTVFAFEELSDGVASVPIEEVKAMYDEMKTVFDYVLVSDNPLAYRGYYEGDTSFVDGYERYQNADVDMKISNPVNVVYSDRGGSEIMTTPLKTVLLGESIFNRFDSSIEEGRNLQMSDFTLAAPNEPISVVLGNAYKDIYELGDIFSLELISEVMDFKVVGFYKSGIGFSMDVGALKHVNFDHTIVMPHFIPEYEPVGEAAVFQHAFHIAELTSGYISIPESVEKINDDTYDHTVAIMEEMAERNNLSGLYKIPHWPVGFVW
ncbi:hypothetical protein [Sporosarcina limicola]|uniref:Lipoprotein n=1 Tax=Sporosarcina limicola TaxID=34101 RepID=A0A927MGN0_9BACL|nr:hypothetical protein [Sporosarcina limicola]MBE1554273.1 hypothetical protein [Sporosarcina limicola]